MNWNDFFYMGGYAGYVWSSYGLALLVLLYNIIVPLRQKRKILTDMMRRAKRARNIT